MSVAEDREARRQADRAASWKRDEQLEVAAKRRAAGRRLSPLTRMSLGYYLEGRAAAKAEGVDVGDGA